MKAFNRSAIALVYPARIGIKNEAWIEDGFDHPDDGVVQNPINDGCLMDVSFLRVKDEK